MEPEQAPVRPWPSPVKAWYAVAVLVIAFVFSFIDRIILSLIAEPLKLDLGLSLFGEDGRNFGTFHRAVKFLDLIISRLLPTPIG